MPSPPVDFGYLRSVVLEESGNVLDPSRDYLFRSRLQSLLQTTGLKSLDRLVAVLREKPQTALRQAVTEAMTVKETSFFRDRSPFDLLQSELLPALIRRRESGRSLRLWSAACSSGQEAYSLAMLLREHFPQVSGWQIEIIATDLSRNMIERALTGRYQRREVSRGLPARYRTRYMRQRGEEWEVAPEVRRMCRFHPRNLCDLPLSPPLSLEQYDGILLRNLLMYFSDETRKKLLLGVHRMLAPDGFLLLGSSEQPGLPAHFQAVLEGNACYYRPLPSPESAA